MGVRTATHGDLDIIVALADEKRRQYADYAPVFHRPAANAAEVHKPWIARLLGDDGAAVLVSEHGSGARDGFLIATLVASPPVYDPGGLTCSVDDFVVAAPARWDTVGRALLQAAQAWGRERGAVQTVVVCGAHDGLKRKMLIECGLAVVSEWFTAPL